MNVYKCNFKECPNSKPEKAALNTSIIYKPCSCYEVFYCSSECIEKDKKYHKCSKSPTFQQQEPSVNASFIPLVDETLNSSTSSMSRRNQRQLEDYEFVNLPKKTNGDLGKGAYGEVKLVKEKASGKLYALKQINKKNLKLKGNVDQMKKEIKLQKKLNHPHILKLYHKFEDPQFVYFVLEYAEKGSVFQYIKKKRNITEDEAFYFFIQTCLAVDYLHRQGIIHRDLKPENLLLDANGNIKVGDFGWSTQITDQRSTQCGTPDYMCPEILKFEQHDQTVDIWSLGIFLFELLNGYAPFSKQGAQSFKLIEEMKRQEKEGISFAKNFSAEVQDLVTKILQMDSKKRLNCKQIYEHPWCQGMLKKNNWKIEKGLLAPNDAHEVQKREPTPEKQKKPGFNDLFDNSPQTMKTRSPSTSIVGAVSTQQLAQNRNDSIQNITRNSNSNNKQQPPSQRSSSQNVQKSQLDISTASNNRSASPNRPVQQHSSLFQKAVEKQVPQSKNDTSMNETNNSLLDIPTANQLIQQQMSTSKSPARKPIFQTDNKDTSNSFISQNSEIQDSTQRGRQMNNVSSNDESSRKSPNKIFQASSSPSRSNTQNLSPNVNQNTNQNNISPSGVNNSDTSSINDLSGSKSPLRKKIFEKSPGKSSNEYSSLATVPQYLPQFGTATTGTYPFNEPISPLLKAPNQQYSTGMQQTTMTTSPQNHTKSSASNIFDPSSQQQKFPPKNNVSADETLDLSLSSIPNDISMISDRSAFLQTTQALQGNTSISSSNNKSAPFSCVQPNEQALINKYISIPSLSRSAKEIDFTKMNLQNKALMEQIMKKLKKDHKEQLDSIEKKMQELKKENKQLKEYSMKYSKEQLEINAQLENLLKGQIKGIEESEKQQLNDYQSIEKEQIKKQQGMNQEYKAKKMELEMQQEKLQSEYLKLEQQQVQQSMNWKKQLGDQLTQLKIEFENKQKQIKQEYDNKFNTENKQSHQRLQQEQQGKFDQLLKEYTEKEKELNKKKLGLQNENKNLENQQKEEQKRLKKQLEQRTQELELLYDSKYKQAKEEFEKKYELAMQRIQESEVRRIREMNEQQQTGIERVQQLEESFIKLENNYVDQEQALTNEWRIKQEEFQIEYKEMKKNLVKIQKDQQERQVLWEKQLIDNYKKQKSIYGGKDNLILNNDLIEEMKKQQKVLKDEQDNFILQWEKQQDERVKQMQQQQDLAFKEIKKDYHQRQNELEERLRKQKEEYQFQTEQSDSSVDDSFLLEKEIRTKYLQKQKLCEDSQKQVIQKYDQLENQQRQQRDSIKKQFSTVVKQIEKNYEIQQKKLKQDLEKKQMMDDSKNKGSENPYDIFNRIQAEEDELLQINLQKAQKHYYKQMKKLDGEYNRKQNEFKEQQENLKSKSENEEKGEEEQITKLKNKINKKSSKLEKEYQKKQQELKDEMDQKSEEFQRQAKERKIANKKDYQTRLKEREDEMDRLRQEAIDNSMEITCKTRNELLDEEYRKKQMDLEQQYKKLQSYCEQLKKQQESTLSQQDDKMEQEIRKIQAEYFQKQIDLQKELNTKEKKARESIKNGKKGNLDQLYNEDEERGKGLRNIEEEANQRIRELENQYKYKQDQIIQQNQEMLDQIKGDDVKSKGKIKKSELKRTNSNSKVTSKLPSPLKEESQEEDSGDEQQYANKSKGKQSPQQSSRSLSKEGLPPKYPSSHKRSQSEKEEGIIEVLNLDSAQNPSEIKEMLKTVQESINKLNNSLLQQQELSLSFINKSTIADLSMESNLSKIRRIQLKNQYQKAGEKEEFYDPMINRTYLEQSLLSQTMNKSRISQRKLEILNESLQRKQERDILNESGLSTISQDSSRIMRATRVREAEIENKVPPKKEEMGFFDKIKSAFGCGSRR